MKVSMFDTKIKYGMGKNTKTKEKKTEKMKQKWGYKQRLR